MSASIAAAAPLAAVAVAAAGAVDGRADKLIGRLLDPPTPLPALIPRVRVDEFGGGSPPPTRAGAAGAFGRAVDRRCRRCPAATSTRSRGRGRRRVRRGVSRRRFPARDAAPGVADGKTVPANPFSEVARRGDSVLRGVVDGASRRRRSRSVAEAALRERGDGQRRGRERRRSMRGPLLERHRHRDSSRAAARRGDRVVRAAAAAAGDRGADAGGRQARRAAAGERPGTSALGPRRAPADRQHARGRHHLLAPSRSTGRPSRRSKPTRRRGQAAQRRRRDHGRLKPTRSRRHKPTDEPRPRATMATRSRESATSRWRAKSRGSQARATAASCRSVSHPCRRGGQHRRRGAREDAADDLAAGSGTHEIVATRDRYVGRSRSPSRSRQARCSRSSVRRRRCTSTASPAGGEVIVEGKPARQDAGRRDARGVPPL